MKRLLLFVPLFVFGCQPSQQPAGNTTVLIEGRQTEENQKKLATATPPPQFEHSLERDNLVARLKTLNVQNKIMYIFCMSLDGKVVYSGLVQGKVSSLNSLLTTPDQLVWTSGYTDHSNGHYEKMPSPDFDGSYGKNPDGIFWFAPDGGYHEWSGTYLLSDRPEKVNTPISITATVDLEKK